MGVGADVYTWGVGWSGDGGDLPGEEHEFGGSSGLVLVDYGGWDDSACYRVGVGDGVLMATTQQLVVQATSSAGGDASFSFAGLAPAGETLVGTLSIPAAPAASQITVALNGLEVVSVYGPCAAGPVAIQAGDSAVLSATGLVADTLYQAVFTCAAYSSAGAPAAIPAPTPVATQIIGGTVDVTSTGPLAVDVQNASIPVTGSVEVSTASGVTLDVSVQNASIPVTGSVSADITNATLDVTGSVDVSTASGTTLDVSGSTISISGTVDAQITNATLDVAGGVTVNNTSLNVGVTNESVGGESLPSPAGSTTTGNATLSATDYNLVSWAAVPLPAGSPGNLVYDSNLENAIASVGPTWSLDNGATIGTANGDFTVVNPGSNDAEIIFYGTGVATPTTQMGLVSAYVPVVHGATYVFSSYIDATNETVSGVAIDVVNGADGTDLSYVVQTPGVAGVVSGTYVVPVGVTSIGVRCYIYGGTVTAGATVSWSQIQLTETSTVQTYAPGPLRTYRVYGRNGQDRLLGSTTALALEDTGQGLQLVSPAASNTTSPTLPAPAVPTVTVEGTTGTTTYEYVVSVLTAAATGVLVSGGQLGITRQLSALFDTTDMVCLVDQAPVPLSMAAGISETIDLSSLQGGTDYVDTLVIMAHSPNDDLSVLELQWQAATVADSSGNVSPMFAVGAPSLNYSPTASSSGSYYQEVWVVPIGNNEYVGGTIELLATNSGSATISETAIFTVYGHLASPPVVVSNTAGTTLDVQTSSGVGQVLSLTPSDVGQWVAPTVSLPGGSLVGVTLTFDAAPPAGAVISCALGTGSATSAMPVTPMQTQVVPPTASSGNPLSLQFWFTYPELPVSPSVPEIYVVSNVSGWTAGSMSLLLTMASSSSPPYLVRADGRCRPAGMFVTSAIEVVAGTPTLVAAPAAPYRLLLRRLWIIATATSGGDYATINGTVGGASSMLVYSNADTYSPQPAEVEWDDGLLLDVATALTGRFVGAGAAYGVEFDLVA